MYFGDILAYPSDDQGIFAASLLFDTYNVLTISFENILYRKVQSFFKQGICVQLKQSYLLNCKTNGVYSYVELLNKFNKQQLKFLCPQTLQLNVNAVLK